MLKCIVNCNRFCAPCNTISTQINVGTELIREANRAGGKKARDFIRNKLFTGGKHLCVGVMDAKAKM
jgi:hypothetical protein